MVVTIEKDAGQGNNHSIEEFRTETPRYSGRCKRASGATIILSKNLELKHLFHFEAERIALATIILSKNLELKHEALARLHLKEKSNNHSIEEFRTETIFR